VVDSEAVLSGATEGLVELTGCDDSLRSVVEVGFESGTGMVEDSGV
jgi:hypothetical protein